MDLYNNTDFSALSFKQIQAGTGEFMACLVVKATCNIVPSHPLIFSEQQDPIAFEDRYVNDPHTSALIECADIVPFKPHTDVTLISNAKHPNPESGLSFEAGCIVGDEAYRLQINPARTVQYCNDSWQERPAAPSDHIPLSWQQTYGGVIDMQGDPPFAVVRENPIGCGALNLQSASTAQEFLLPCIADPDDESKRKPWGCAPVPPWWRPRQQHAGTYDDDWLNEIHPRLPDDFDYRFYQVSAPQMIREGYLAGGEALRLVNVLPGNPIVDTRLPSWRPKVAVQHRTNEIQALQLNLDGCHINLCGERAKVTLTWRGWLPQADAVRAFKVEVDGLQTLLDERYQAQAAHAVQPWPAWENDP